MSSILLDLLAMFFRLDLLIISFLRISIDMWFCIPTDFWSFFIGAWSFKVFLNWLLKSLKLFALLNLCFKSFRKDCSETFLKHLFERTFGYILVWADLSIVLIKRWCVANSCLNTFVNWCKFSLDVRIKVVHDLFTNLNQVLFLIMLLHFSSSKNKSSTGLVLLSLKSPITIKSSAVLR